MEVRALRSADEMREAFGPLAQVFSFEIEDEWLERDRRIHPAERMLVARTELARSAARARSRWS